MPNYYEILGLNTSAGIPEIKAAFRHLAKTYHPDLNPHGIEQFALILKAYEVLSDPQLKYSYDLRISSQSRYQEIPKQQKEKNWRFDERELKRRQYYNDHIKKYEKKSNEPTSDTVPTSNYNEFKYILFATPLAVVLFLGIMSLATNKKQLNAQKEAIKYSASSKSEPVSDLKMGDSPFVWYFGSQQYFPESKLALTIQNMSGEDAIIVLFSDHKFVRTCFISDAYSAEISQLPQTPLEIRYSSGKSFAQNQTLQGTDVTGGFQENAAFYLGKDFILKNAINQLTLVSGLNTGFQTITAAEFYIK